MAIQPGVKGVSNLSRVYTDLLNAFGGDAAKVKAVLGDPQVFQGLVNAGVITTAGLGASAVPAAAAAAPAVVPAAATAAAEKSKPKASTKPKSDKPKTEAAPAPAEAPKVGKKKPGAN